MRIAAITLALLVCAGLLWVAGQACFLLLTAELQAPPSAFTIDVTAFACRWHYRYRVGVTSFQIDRGPAPGDESGHGTIVAALGEAVLIPVGKTAQLTVTADADAGIQTFAVPALGVKVQAIPGRLNEAWFQASKTGTYLGGPTVGCPGAPALVALRAVDQASFDAWVTSKGTVP